MTWRGICIATLAAGLLACGGDEPAKAPPRVAPQTETPARAEPAAPTARAPEAAARPYPCIPGDPAAGAPLYATLCASCHGAHGEGDGPAGAGLDPKPTRHNDGATMNPLSNDRLRTVIARGGAAAGLSPQMPAWGSAIGQQGVWDVLAFVRSLAEPAYTCP